MWLEKASLFLFTIWKTRQNHGLYVQKCESFIFLWYWTVFCIDTENLWVISSSQFGISKLHSTSGELQYPTPVTVQGNFAFHCGGLLLSKQLCASLSDISVALSSAKGNQKWGGRQIIALDDANCECLTGILAFRNGLCCDWGWKLLGTLQGKACACLQNWTGRSC